MPGKSGVFLPCALVAALSPRGWNVLSGALLSDQRIFDMTKELLRGALVAGAAVALLGLTACTKKEEAPAAAPAADAAASSADAAASSAAAAAAPAADAMATTPAAPAADAMATTPAMPEKK